MNTVRYNKTPLPMRIILGQLPPDETAFIGKCGIGPAHSLYLIVRDGLSIVYADNPSCIWDNKACPITIDRFVDIDIVVKEKP
jgi:hypothetical protein